MIDEMFAGYDEAELQETMDAERDVLGTKTKSYILQRDESVVQAAIQGMQEAIAAIPPAQKEAYTYMLETAPTLLERESPLKRFLLVCDYNYWAAAQKLVDFWQERKEIFGEKNFAKPLSLVDGAEGTALPLTVRELLMTGAFATLQHDKYGRGVIYLDDAVCIDSEAYRLSKENIRLQITFYLLQALSESDLTVVNGVSVIHIFGSASTTGKKFVRDGKVARYSQSTQHPAKPVACHILCNRQSSLVEKQLLKFHGVLRDAQFIRSRTRVHFLEKNEEILDTFRQFGFGEGHLPERLGGKMSALKWCQERMQVDRFRYGKMAAPTDLIQKSKPDKEHREKRKMEDFQIWAKDHLQSQKLMKLESQVAALKTANTELSKRNVFLEAQANCADFVRNRFEEHQKELFQQFKENLHLFPGIAQEVLDFGDEQQLAFVRNLFETHLFFLGKSPVVCEWMFQCKPGLTRDQALFANVLKEWLLEVLAKNQGEGSACTEPSESLIASASDEEDDMLLEQEIDRLKTTIESLRKQNASMRTDGDFLNSTLVIASELGNAYETFYHENIGVLAGYYAGALSLDAARFSWTDKLPAMALSIASFVLSQYTFLFQGERFGNFFVDMASSPGETPTDRALTRTGLLMIAEPLLKQAFRQGSISFPDIPILRGMPGDESDNRTEEQQSQQEIHRHNRLKRKKALKRL